jgi:hypothetical protein
MNPADNALKHGLFAAHDFVRDHERPEYDQTLADLTAEIEPSGVLEHNLTAEIMSALWRLRRCRELESTPADPGADTNDTETSLARARSHAQNSLRRATAELRKIQTERFIRTEIDSTLPVLTNARAVLAALKLSEQTIAIARKNHPDPNQLPDFNDTAALDAWLARNGNPLLPPAPSAEPAPTPENPFCKKTETTPRNAPCPCHSGQKFKRCCGKDAPPVLNKAA